MVLPTRSPDVIAVVAYRPAHFDSVKALWEEAFPDYAPYNRAERAIPAKLSEQPELFFVAEEDGAVVGTIMAGYDGHRGWLYAVAVRATHRQRGVGAALVRTAEAALDARGCVKINLQVLETNAGVIGFYERLGYAVEPRVSMGKRC